MLLLCGERGSCLTVPTEEGLCADTLAERAGGEGSIQRQHCPMWQQQQQQHKPAEQRTHTCSSIHHLHLPLSLSSITSICLSLTMNFSLFANFNCILAWKQTCLLYNLCTLFFFLLQGDNDQHALQHRRSMRTTWNVFFFWQQKVKKGKIERNANKLMIM